MITSDRIADFRLAVVLALLAAALAAWLMGRGGRAPAADEVERPPPAYEARLQLSAEHLEALRPVVSSTADEMRRIRRDMRLQLSKTVDDLNAAIAKDIASVGAAAPPPR